MKRRSARRDQEHSDELNAGLVDAQGTGRVKRRGKAMSSKSSRIASAQASIVSPRLMP